MKSITTRPLSSDDLAAAQIPTRNHRVYRDGSWKCEVYDEGRWAEAHHDASERTTVLDDKPATATTILAVDDDDLPAFVAEALRGRDLL